MIKVIKLKIDELIKKKGFEEKSLRSIAKEMGISHVTLWDLLHKKNYNPSLAMLDRLCEFFKCKPGDLLEYKGK